MFHKTGDGLVEVNPDFTGVGVLEALLSNFDFDDFAGHTYRPLKKQHADFLEKKVVPLLENDRGQIWMCGSASRVGASDWNMTLSQTRVGRVAGYLMQNGVDGSQMQTEAIGNTKTADHKLDDDRDRSVLLRVVPKIHFKPVEKPNLPRALPPKPKVSRHFKIAMLLELDGTLSLAARQIVKKLAGFGAGIAFGAAYFRIVDTENHLKCDYVWAGAGLGAGFSLPKTGSRSATLSGPWNAFTTEKPITSSQFGPSMRFTTAGIGSLSVNWILIETPPGVSDVYMRIDTGTTLGISMATYPAHLTGFVPLEAPKPYSDP
jgi:OmpA family protein